jgi:hypothetical protein
MKADYTHKMMHHKNLLAPRLFIPGAFLFMAAVMVVLAGCPAPNLPEFWDRERIAEYRDFYAQRVDIAYTNFYRVNTAKLAEGKHCIIFADVETAVSVRTARNVAAEYDSRIHPIITGAFGDYIAAGYDVDNNGKIIIVLMDIKDGYNGSGSYVAGYFDPTHMYSGALFSNRADMIFIDVDPLIPGSEEFYANISHELQHLINYALHGGTSQEVWINEGLSSAAEYLYGGPRKDKVNYFNADPQRTIAVGNNFFVWNGYWEQEMGDSMANYATVYLFFQWLRIHGGGDSIYRAIGNAQYLDYRAVTRAVKSHLPDITETRDPEIWDRLLRSWMIANLVNAPAGLYGYKGEIDTQVYYITCDEPQTNSFSPGEGIYSYLKDKSFSDRADSGNHIKYMGVGIHDIDTTSPYTGEILLTYNANHDPAGEDERGYVLSRAGAEDSPAAPVRSAVPSAGTAPASYPVGIQDLRAHRSAGGGGPR